LLDVVPQADPVVLDVGACGRRDIPAIHLIGEGCGRAPVATANLVEEGVAGDPPQPTLEAARLVGLETAPDPQEDFLNQVGRVFRVTGEPVGEVVELPSVDTGYLFPGEWDGLHRALLLERRRPSDGSQESVSVVSDWAASASCAPCSIP